MNCELCGMGDKEFYRVDIDGSELIVCGRCSKLGRVKEVLDQNGGKKSALGKKPETVAYRVADPEYVGLIEDAMKVRGLGLEDLALKLKESKETLKKVIGGKILPSQEIADKLLKELGVKVFLDETSYFKANIDSKEATFEDVVEIKKRK